MNVKLTKWGNSFGIRISKDLIQGLSLSEGDTLTVDQTDKKIILTPIFLKKKKTLQDYLNNWDPNAQHELLDWGPVVGKEIW